MRETPRLSICMTTFNHEKFIREALDSVFSQIVDCSFEIIIGDDASTDSTVNILKEYQLKFPDIIRLIIRDKNVGVIKNLNEVFLTAKGEFIAVFDGDDRMKEGKIKKQLELFERYPDITVVGHNLRVFDSDSDKTIRISKPTLMKEFYTIEDVISEHNVYGASSKMFRRSTMPIPPMNESLKLIGDWYLNIFNALHGNVGYIHEVLGEYRVHQKSVMKNIRGVEHFEDIRITIETIEEMHPGKYTHLFKNKWAYAYLVRAIQHLNEGNKKAARKDLMKTIRNKPNYSITPYFYLIWSLSPMFTDKIFQFVKAKLK